MNVAIDIADVIVFVVDFTLSITHEDKKIADLLRKSNKKVILAINKYDIYIKDDPNLFEYYNFGLEFFPISADNGIGIGDLLDEITSSLPNIQAEEEERIKVALIRKT